MSTEWIVVTGASRGIGRSTALRLAADGFGVALWSRSADQLAQLAKQIAARGGQARYAAVDVSDAGAVRQESARLRDIGVLKAVVVNAGSGHWRPFLETTPDQWRDTLATNLDGAFHTLRSLLPLLIEHGSGQVVAIGSDSALYSMAGRAAYCASKAGLRSLVETIRLEVRALGVRTTVLLPSRVDTFFGGKQAGDRPQALRPEDIAELVGLVLTLPPHVEVRELEIAAITEVYGPFPERVSS